MDSLIGNTLYFGAAIYLLSLWIQDYRSRNSASPPPKPLPGATPAGREIALIAALGSLVILSLEVFGEKRYHLEELQTTITWSFLLSMLAAGIVEEILFRGYLVISSRGRGLLWGSIIVFSLLFTLIHPYLWSYSTPEGVPFWDIREASFAITLTEKALFTSFFVLLNSIWFYWLRFCPWNPTHSLIPCFVAHLTSNAGVFLVKLCQGHVEPLF